LRPSYAPEEPHALIIGLDGVRPDCLLAAHTPNLDSLIAEGAFTWDAFAGGGSEAAAVTTQATSSGPGWTSILTGVWRDKHGVYDNSFGGSDLVNYPHLFGRIRAAHPDTELVSLAHWAPINEHLLSPFPGMATLAVDCESDLEVTVMALGQLDDANPGVLFLHFDDVDHAGHAFGYSALVPEYLAAIELVDEQLGLVLEGLHARERETGERWLVMATTDHGGLNTGHGGQSEAERTIWMVARGPGIRQGAVSPGPGHTAVARTVLQHMLGEVPEAWGLADEQAFGLAPQ
jgi:predicted AlkP superfamily pyrophosphatase or phosphodiesterase